VWSKSHPLVIQICNSARGISLQQLERHTFASNIPEGKICGLLNGVIEVLVIDLDIQTSLLGARRP